MMDLFRTLLGVGMGVIGGTMLWCAEATVTFSFQDAGAEYGPGILDSERNSISIFPGQTFKFDIWMNATDNNWVSGFDFKLNFIEYVTGNVTFTLESNLDRTGSDFTDGFGEFDVSYKEQLTPTNSDPNDPSYGKTLGALLPIEDTAGWRTSVLYLGSATLSADPNMAPGTYHIGPDDRFYGWISYEGEMIYLGNDTFTPYTVNVIPEPSMGGLIIGIGLIGWAIIRKSS